MGCLKLSYQGSQFRASGCEITYNAMQYTSCWVISVHTKQNHVLLGCVCCLSAASLLLP